MRYTKYILGFLLGIIVMPLTASAVNVSWDFSNNILTPLKSMWSNEVRVPWITATSTTQVNTFPLATFTTATSTTLCLTGDSCITSWPSSAVWGSITGTLSNQTDLQNALNTKLSTTTAASTYYPLTNPAGYTNNTGTVTSVSGGTGLTGTVTTSGSIALDSASIASLGKADTALQNITGLISAGTNITLNGSGTSGSPYIINASGGGNGLATTSPWTTGQLAQVVDNGTVRSIATSSLGLPTFADILSTSTIRSLFSGVSPINYNNLTGNISLGTVDISSNTNLAASVPITLTGDTVGIIQAGSSSNGFLSSTDWNTFNSKGDVVGPSSSTDNAITRFDTTTGKLIQNSLAVIDDNGAITASGFIPTATTATGNRMYLPATNTLGWSINGTGEMRLTATALSPNDNDGNALGTTALSWSDLFLASGGVINFGNGNSTLTHSTGVLTVSQGDLRITTAGINSDSVVTVGGNQVLSNKTLSNPILNGTINLIGTLSGGTIASTTLGSSTNALTAKTTPVDNDMFGLMDSTATNVMKKLSWANLKVAIASFFTSFSGISNGNVLTASSTAPFGMIWATQSGGSGIDIQEFTSSDTWSKPTGAKTVLIEMWGGGGGGGGSSGSFSGGGGGGGHYISQTIDASQISSSVYITVGAGGTGGTGNGGVGGNSSFGSYITAYGGGSGQSGAGGAGSGGGGGGLAAAGSAGNSSGAGYGTANPISVATKGANGSGGDDSGTAGGGDSYYGGAGGSGRSNNAIKPGGNSIWGGAGGAGGNTYSTNQRVGGTSVFGGNGGAGVSGNSSGQGGSGGGGYFDGSDNSGTTGGAGGGGFVRVTTFF